KNDSILSVRACNEFRHRRVSIGQQERTHGQPGVRDPTTDRSAGMDPSQIDEQTRQLDDFVEAYESAWARGLRPEIDEFLPAADHPLRRQVLSRLIHLDLRHRWAQGQPRLLTDYQGRFPELT